MKIGTPELKTKPATKYFDGGYVKFSTDNKELSYQIWIYKDKTLLMKLEDGKVKDQEHLTKLLTIKTKTELITA